MMKGLPETGEETDRKKERERERAKDMARNSFTENKCKPNSEPLPRNPVFVVLCAENKRLKSAGDAQESHGLRNGPLFIISS